MRFMNKLAAVKSSCSGKTGKDLFAASLFVVLTVIMTYPVAFRLTSSIPGDLGDPLLNTWILAWDAHKIMELDIAGFFNANIFFPYQNTLAYSEHLFGNMIFAFPVLLVFKNPVLAYNTVFLSGIFLSGLGMYLLSLYLTGNRLAAFTSGVIYAFFPWRFAQVGHLQMQVAEWIPLTFLYFYKFRDSLSYRHLLLFTLFFLLQFLSCGYYALFLGFFIGILILLEIRRKGISDKAFLSRIALFAIISGVVIVPFFYPYVKVKREMGFSRSFDESVMFSADILSYLSATNLNRFWGGITGKFLERRHHEGELFLGLTAFLIGSYGMSGFEIPAIAIVKRPKPLVLKIASLIIFFLMAAVSIQLFLMLYAGGVNTTVFGINIRATNLYKPLSILFALGFTSLLLERRFRAYLCAIHKGLAASKKAFFLFVLISSILFSMGPILHFNGKEIIYGPYILLYKFVPGFSGLRVPARFIIMTALALSVFAAFGMFKVLVHIKTGWMKALFTALVSGLILFESASMPLPMPSVAIGDDVPEVYKWLGKEKGDFAILELPMPKSLEGVAGEAKCIYYSTYHWKKLVNGYSGYFPRSYVYLYQAGMKDFPSPASVALLNDLDIKYLIIHSGEYGKEEFEKIENTLRNRGDVLRPVKRFGPDHVYEVQGRPPFEFDMDREIKTVLTVRASVPGAEFAIDGDIRTRWSTGRAQRPSDYFEADLGEVKKLSGIMLELGPDFWNYPRGFLIELSRDGRSWKSVKSEPDAVAPLRSFIKNPKKIEVAIPFESASGRYVKITQTGESPDKFWSISEIHFFE